MNFGFLDISMVTTRGQENTDRGALASPEGNSSEQLASSVQNILKQGMR